jgi:hypothetical protein
MACNWSRSYGNDEDTKNTSQDASKNIDIFITTEMLDSFHKRNEILEKTFLPFIRVSNQAIQNISLSNHHLKRVFSFGFMDNYHLLIHRHCTIDISLVVFFFSSSSLNV